MKSKCDYVRPDSLYTVVKNKIKNEERFQIKQLASCLRDPDNLDVSTWPKFIRFISEILLNRDTHPTAKEIIHLLSDNIKQVNHEINYIQAKVTNIAEMTITTLAFAHTIKHL